MVLTVQSVRISKKLTKKQADEEVKKMGYKLGVKPNPQYKNYHSYRQIQPQKFKDGSFRIKKLSADKLLVLGVLK
tara:strand:- start:412 stop:636 length:225 start_codon:yes stop_codon:yes gene_type:complete